MFKNQGGDNKADILMGVYYRPPNHDEEADKKSL